MKFDQEKTIYYWDRPINIGIVIGISILLKWNLSDDNRNRIRNGDVDNGK